MTFSTISTKIRLKGIIILILHFSLIPYLIILDFFFYNIYLKNKNDNSPLFIGLVLTLIFSYIIIKSLKFTFENVTLVKVSDAGIKIKRPLLLKSDYYNWSEIKGYSKSDYLYLAKPMSSSRCIIIYTKNNLTFEIIEMYNTKYIEFQTFMSKVNVVYFGKEKYERGKALKRKKYKFIELYNN